MKRNFDTLLWVVVVLIVVVLGIMMMGCKSTCEPITVTVPEEVFVPVQVPCMPVLLPTPPEYEVCNQQEPRERMLCLARNVIKLEDYAERLLEEIESYNAELEE